MYLLRTVSVHVRAVYTLTIYVVLAEMANQFISVDYLATS